MSFDLTTMKPQSMWSSYRSAVPVATITQPENIKMSEKIFAFWTSAVSNERWRGKKRAGKWSIMAKGGLGLFQNVVTLPLSQTQTKLFYFLQRSNFNSVLSEHVIFTVPSIAHISQRYPDFLAKTRIANSRSKCNMVRWIPCQLSSQGRQGKIQHPPLWVCSLVCIFLNWCL